MFSEAVVISNTLYEVGVTRCNSPYFAHNMMVLSMDLIQKMIKASTQKHILPLIMPMCSLIDNSVSFCILTKCKRPGNAFHAAPGSTKLRWDPGANKTLKLAYYSLSSQLSRRKLQSAILKAYEDSILPHKGSQMQ